jgi:iron complex outermembrane receptor protein
MRFIALPIALILLSLVSTSTRASEIDPTTLPLESLLELKVTSVSKKSQQLTDAAAAVFVITQEDIRRSGVTTIADALRMVPGVQVARIDSNKWAVSARGFNGRFANKLLVLMDGRSLYTPFFIGVYWEVQDTPLEDIDRIEVIRGPGAALWGANAVNGVINIITKPTELTHGTLVSGGGGTYEKSFLTVRHGMPLGDAADLRVYGKYLQRDDFVDAAGDDTHDAWRLSQGGFRIDSKPTPRDALTLQGDYYAGRLDETFQLYGLPATSVPPYISRVPSTTSVSGGNLLVRWQRQLAGTDSLSLQSYYDHSQRQMLILPQEFDTFDLELQHRLALGTQQDLIWGVGYRFGDIRLGESTTLSFHDRQTSSQLYSAFLHDEITLVPNRLALILGARLEHNDVSGMEVQPNGRLIWTPTPQHSVWGAISRAVRSATSGEQDIVYRYRTLPTGSPANPLPLPLRLEIIGNPGFKSESVIAYEVGYRTEPLVQLTMDVALFYNDYRHLRVVSPGTPYTEPSGGAPVNAVQPFILSNDMHGYAYGAEVAFDWLPLSWWRLKAAYTFERLFMYLDGTSTDLVNRGNAVGDTPRHQFSLRSDTELGRDVTLDLWLRCVENLASIDSASIPGYVTLDARLAWKPLKTLELALVGQNLFDSRHPEFIPEYINTVPSETPRSIFGKATWKFQ